MNAASLGSIYALVALGIALIYGIMNLLNFAHGDLLTISAYTMFVVGVFFWPLLMLSAIVVTVLAALLMERFAFRPVRRADASTMLITSFAVSYLLQNVGVLVFSARPRGLSVPPDILRSSIELFGVRVAALDVVTTVVTLLLLAGLVLFLKLTRVGLQMRAAAEDFTMTRALGVRANRTIAFAFALSGALAAIAGILLVAKSGTLTPRLGLTPLIIAFVATIVGGLSSLVGAVLGAYLLGAMTVALQVALPLEMRPFRDAFLFGAVVLILVVRPQGLIVAKHAKARV